MDHSSYVNPDTIRDLIQESKTIAVVGLSDNPGRDSNMVAAYLQRQGYKIVPVNPNKDAILGEKSYPDLASIPVSVDLIDVFRRSEVVDPIADEAIKIEAKGMWLQLGVINEAAAKKAFDAGLKVVMNRCLKVEHARLRGN
jgi:predicted CoA-binding protein